MFDMKFSGLRSVIMMIIGKKFNYAKATAFPLFFTLKDGKNADGRWSHSVGMPDWCPVAVAAMLMEDEKEGLLILAGALDRDCWFSDKEQFKEWACRYRERAAVLDRFRCHHPLYEQMVGSELSYLVKDAFLRMNPPVSNGFLCNTEGFAKGWSLGSDARSSAEKYWTKVQDVMLDWFVGCGFEVDRERMLVKLPGYQPLVTGKYDPADF